MLIVKLAVLALDGQLFGFRWFNSTYDLGIYLKTFGNLDDILSNLLIYIEFHAVSAIKNLVHFLPISTGLLLDQFEQRWYGEHIILDDMKVVHKVKDLRLCSPTTVYHPVDFLGGIAFQYLFDDGRIGPCGRQHQFSGIQR